MAKELRISIVVPVSDDLFEQAATVHAVKPVLEHVARQLESLNARVTHELVTPRAAKSE